MHECCSVSPVHPPLHAGQQLFCANECVHEDAIHMRRDSIDVDALSWQKRAGIFDLIDPRGLDLDRFETLVGQLRSSSSTYLSSLNRFRPNPGKPEPRTHRWGSSPASCSTTPPYFYIDRSSSAIHKGEVHSVGSPDSAFPIRPCPASDIVFFFRTSADWHQPGLRITSRSWQRIYLGRSVERYLL